MLRPEPEQVEQEAPTTEAPEKKTSVAGIPVTASIVAILATAGAFAVIKPEILPEPVQSIVADLLPASAGTVAPIQPAVESSALATPVLPPTTSDGWYVSIHERSPSGIEFNDQPALHAWIDEDNAWSETELASWLPRRLMVTGGFLRTAEIDLLPGAWSFKVSTPLSKETTKRSCSVRFALSGTDISKSPTITAGESSLDEMAFESATIDIHEPTTEELMIWQACQVVDEDGQGSARLEREHLLDANADKRSFTVTMVNEAGEEVSMEPRTSKTPPVKADLNKPTYRQVAFGTSWTDFRNTPDITRPQPVPEGGLIPIALDGASGFPVAFSATLTGNGDSQTIVVAASTEKKSGLVCATESIVVGGGVGQQPRSASLFPAGGVGDTSFVVFDTTKGENYDISVRAACKLRGSTGLSLDADGMPTSKEKGGSLIVF